VLLPAWAWVVAWLLAKLLREPRGWRALYGISAMSLGLHIAGDLITGYGTQILWPLSDWRPALGATFVIDLWFSGIILAGLAVSAFFYRSRIPESSRARCWPGMSDSNLSRSRRRSSLAGNTPPAAASRRRR